MPFGHLILLKFDKNPKKMIASGKIRLDYRAPVATYDNFNLTLNHHLIAK